MSVHGATVGASEAVTGGSIHRQWQRLSGLPGGRWLFGRLIARKVPYSGTVAARVEEMGAGLVRVRMRDRRAVRNHLDSIHACAQVTLGEMASGLAMLTRISDDARAIVTGLEIEYLKKARGTLIARGESPAVEPGVRREYVATAEIKDASGDAVSRLRVRWLVGPRRAAGEQPGAS
ncbi:MAG: DUF4442 domain-containing protein [Acidobacteriota bacterium]|nr:DUF4442 domain-containing protein [Acidobacteriota bacterium]